MQKQIEQTKEAMDQLGPNYTTKVYRVENDKPVEVAKEEWGHFFSEDIFIVDLESPKYRYLIMWIGPKLDMDKLSATSKYFEILTDYAYADNITRVRRRKHKESEQLLEIFKD